MTFNYESKIRRPRRVNEGQKNDIPIYFLCEFVDFDVIFQYI